jgi:ATP dependent DNA ligase-like protein
MLPRWAWIMIASVLFVIVESVIARLATPADSFIRTTWSLSQLAIGVIAVAGCHIFNFLVLAADDADVGLLDLLLKPIKLWIKAVHNLPTRLWVADAATSGLAAIVMSIVVIGGIPYERLWDWGFKEPVKQNLMGAVMDHMKKLDSRDGNDDLEGAIGDFAGSQNLDPDATKQPPPKPRNHTDCVILGYRLDRDGRLTTLLLGIANRGQLVYAGNVTPKLPAEEMSALTNMLKQIETRDPFIRVEAEATWVEAKYTCRVTFGQRTKEGRLREVEWDKMLGKIERK